jgi:hypothetical protein
MAQSSSRVSAATRTSPDPKHSSLLDAVVAAARFERSVRRVRFLRTERGQGKGKRGAPTGNAGVPLALATRELRRLTD